MQITRDQVQQCVYVILRERAEDIILRKQPDEYYGWVPDQYTKDGELVERAHWIGERDETTAKQALADAQRHLARCQRDQQEARYFHETTPVEDAVLTQAKVQLCEAEAHLAKVQHVNALAITKRRELMIERKAKNLFLRLYQKARAVPWDLYHPAVSTDLRRYLTFWKDKPGLTPSSVVFLYLVLQETIAHGESHQVDAITGYDHLAKIPLMRARLDVEACEDEPSRADQEYVRALQAQMRYDARPDAHENGDRRDVLADWQYDGLPDQLGALVLDKNDGHECANCHEKITTKTVHSPKGYAVAEVCPNHKTKAGCTHAPVTPRFATKTQLREFLCLQWALAEAA